MVIKTEKVTGLPKLLVEGETKENSDKLLILYGNVYKIEILQVPCNKCANEKVLAKQAVLGRVTRADWIESAE